MSKQVELVKARTFELDPDKFYMAFINWPKSGLSKDDLYSIKFPHAVQHPNLLWVLCHDDPNDVIEIIEVPLDERPR